MQNEICFYLHAVYIKSNLITKGYEESRNHQMSARQKIFVLEQAASMFQRWKIGFRSVGECKWWDLYLVAAVPGNMLFLEPKCWLIAELKSQPSSCICNLHPIGFPCPNAEMMKQAIHKNSVMTLSFLDHTH